MILSPFYHLLTFLSPPCQYNYIRNISKHLSAYLIMTLHILLLAEPGGRLWLNIHSFISLCFSLTIVDSVFCLFVCLSVLCIYCYFISKILTELCNCSQYWQTSELNYLFKFSGRYLFQRPHTGGRSVTWLWRGGEEIQGLSLSCRPSTSILHNQKYFFVKEVKDMRIVINTKGENKKERE